jgi:hypothetical protein
VAGDDEVTVVERTLFDRVPDEGCTMCGGRGYFIAYRHGQDPKNYPRFRCACVKAVAS